MRRLRMFVCAVAAAAACGATAQIYPAKPVTLVNAFPPGGPTDIVARQIAAKLSQRFGQQGGIVVPAGAPQSVIARLNAEIAQALADPEIRATFEKQNIEPSPGTAEAFGAWIAAERARWAQVVAKANIKLD